MIPSARNIWSSLRHFVGGLLLFASIYYIATRFTPDWLKVLEKSASPSIVAMLASVLLATFSVAISALVFAAILEPKSLGGAHWRVAREFVRSQLARYLPGKIAGIIYLQIQLHSEYEPKKVISASIFHMGITYAWALVVGCFTLAFYFDLVEHRYRIYGIAVAIVLVLSIYFLRNLISGYWVRLSRLCGFGVDRGLSNYYGILIGVMFQWVPLLFVLVIYLMDSNRAIFYLALYLVASVVSSFVSVTPGAVVVREGLFVYMAASMGASANETTSIAVYLRVLLTLAELSLFLVFEVVSFGNKSYGSSHE